MPLGFFLHFCCMIMLAAPSNWLRLWRGAKGDTQVLRSLFIEDEVLHVISFTSFAIDVTRTLTVGQELTVGRIDFVLVLRAFAWTCHLPTFRGGRQALS
jgi:hypothetical protein